MSRKFKVVAVSGSVQRPSCTFVLVEQLLAALAEVLPINVHLVALEELAPAIDGTPYRDQLPDRVQAELAAIEPADVFVVGNPVYRGSYTGLFRHLFDLVHHEALTNVPVLLATTGGSDRYALVIDHQLRPLFSFFQACTLPLDVYAPEQDFSGHEITSQALYERIALAVTHVLPLLSASSADDLRTASVAQAAWSTRFIRPHPTQDKGPSR